MKKIKGKNLDKSAPTSVIEGGRKVRAYASEGKKRTLSQSLVRLSVYQALEMFVTDDLLKR